MKTKQWILSAMFIAFGSFFMLAMRPVPLPAEKDCLVSVGIVVNVLEGAGKDITVILKDSDKIFYINRGLERGLDLVELRAKLVGQVITIKYPEYWTPLDPSGALRHVSMIQLDGETIFTELKD